jgi:hypothetical protein
VVERWYLFVQLEFPWELGPEDGRYLLRMDALEPVAGDGREIAAGEPEIAADEPRTAADEREPSAGKPEIAAGEPEHVVVLGTLGAARPSWIAPRSGRRRRVQQVDPESEATPVPVTRVTVIDPLPVASEGEAQAWLARLDGEREAWAATRVVNRVLFAQRIAIADAYMREVAPAQALVIRAGWGTGDQVASGHWEQARELPWREPRSRRRTSALRPQERLTELLSGRGQALLCEELTLRARRDVDQGRLRHAQVELEGAYRAALEELAGENRADLASRVAELRELYGGAMRAAPPAEEAIKHALGRLEAALRARTAPGIGAVK